MNSGTRSGVWHTLTERLKSTAWGATLVRHGGTAAAIVWRILTEVWHTLTERLKSTAWGATLVRHGGTAAAIVMLVFTGLLIALGDGGLWENLFPELIGIGWTVLIIDRLIKGREEKRWRPSKDFLFADLLRETNDVLYNVLPEPDRDTGLRIYTYGARDVYIWFDQASDKLSRNQYVKSSIIEYITDPNLSIEFAIRKMKPLYKAQRYFQAIMNSRSYLLEPEIIRHIFEFDQSVKELRDFMSKIDWTKGDERFVVTYDLYDAVASIILIRAYLVKKAGQPLTLDEQRRIRINHHEKIIEQVHKIGELEDREKALDAEFKQRREELAAMAGDIKKGFLE